MAWERVEHELRDELATARKLESLGRLAGGIAHDFNNLLAVILNFADLASRSVDPAHQAAEDIAEIRRAAQRGRDLTRKLLIVGRRDVRRPDRVDLAAVLTGLRPLLRSAVGEAVSTSSCGSTARERSWPMSPRVEQVVVNLAVNARDAMSAGGTLQITTTDVDHGHGALAGRTVAEGRYVCLTVADTGIGMDAETIDAAFDPFFTTKPIGDGSGLGLTIVHGIVRDTGGHMALSSQVGVGTTVTILLPAYDGGPAPGPRPTLAADPPRHGRPPARRRRAGARRGGRARPARGLPPRARRRRL